MHACMQKRTPCTVAPHTLPTFTLASSSRSVASWFGREMRWLKMLISASQSGSSSLAPRLARATQLRRHCSGCHASGLLRIACRIPAVDVLAAAAEAPATAPGGAAGALQGGRAGVAHAGWHWWLLWQRVAAARGPVGLEVGSAGTIAPAASEGAVPSGRRAMCVEPLIAGLAPQSCPVWLLRLPRGSKSQTGKI